MINAINNAGNIKPFLYNDLEYAIFDDYKERQKIKSMLPDSVMSGSGSTYFVLENSRGEKKIIIQNLLKDPMDNLFA